MQDPNDRNQRPRGANWIGIVVFLLIAFGSQILPPVTRAINQATGWSLNSGAVLVALIIGAAVLSTVFSLIRGIAGAAERPSPGVPTLPQVPPTPGRPGSPALPPTTRRPPVTPSPDLSRRSGGSDYGPQNLPGAPKFEPIIDPRILGFSIAGALVFGIIFAALALASGTVP